jgi:hypothetical protein
MLCDPVTFHVLRDASPAAAAALDDVEEVDCNPA